MIDPWFPDAKRSLPGMLVMIGSLLGILLAVTVMLQLGWQAAFGTLGVIGLM